MDRYSVKKGDTLSIIAMKVYGYPSLWRRVYDANRSTIRIPNVVLPGQQLDIPPDMDVKNQRSMMSPSEQLRRPEEGLSYPLEFEALELLIGATALLKGLLNTDA
ncbi:MAG: LysM peptidoglycan-binding domain-containing protein [Planctomycetota bacterium]|nr:LysM peptidoglycan-binding domain-containing protein [Planctomycetota bacterium]